ncbi:AsnC family transcriptional regulator [Candidatus Methylomirabilis sp.]|uniref:siroheme decarboxylase subunit beta n=1 Tax=Candidatus Methylomirabilis sp. TaxID=2032687 RepID=UPI002A60AE7F|nr:AsnC family transcriptional regulator [Candidatus Methylomirabilis sp.]
MIGIDAIDGKLLDAVQAGIPLVERPYRALGEGLGLTEGDVLERIARLKADSIIRNIGAIFDTSRLGYRSSLVGFRLREERVDEAAVLVNAHPGVSHNYLRSFAFSNDYRPAAYCPYNMWFTLAVAPESQLGLETSMAVLARDAGANAARLFPALRVFKIGVRLDMDAEAAGVRKETGNFFTGNGAVGNGLSPTERQIVRVLQHDLALVEEPFREVARQCELDVEAVLAGAQELLQRNIMRRFAAILNHRKAGYAGNVMVAWPVPEEKVEAVGLQMAQFRAVSHCYQRPAYPEWPFTLFTMVHQKSREACEETVAAISLEAGISDYAMLWTTREFKKVRLKYFTEDYAAWEEKAATRIPSKAPLEPSDQAVAHGLAR